MEKVVGGMIPPPGTLKNEKGHYIFVAKHVMSFHSSYSTTQISFWLQLIVEMPDHAPP